MPSDGSGNYSLPAGYLATTGTPIVISQHNPIFEDIRDAMTARIMASGVKPMTGVFKIVDGSVGAPAVALASNPTWGLYKTATGWGVSISGVKAIEFGPDGINTASIAAGTQGFFPEKYSAVGDGTTDDRTALFNCDAAAAAAGQCVILSKIYAVASALTFTAPVQFRPGSRLKPAASRTITFNRSVDYAPGEQAIDLSASSSAVSIAKIVTPYITPQMFGAAGDGSTDDSGVFQKILNNFSGKKLPLFLPPNTPFNFNSMVEIKSSFLNIFGTGTGSRIINTGAHDAFRFSNATSIEHVQLRDFEIAGPSDSSFAADGYGVRFSAPSNVYPVIRGVTFRSLFGGVAVDLSGSSIDGSTTVNGLNIENVLFRNIKSRGLFLSFATATRLTNVETQMFDRLSTSIGLHFTKWVQDVRGVNVVTLSGGFSLFADNGGSRAPSELKFTESVFDGAGTAAIEIDSGDRHSFTSSWISTPQAGASGVILQSDANRVSFCDCDILNIARYGIVAFSGAQFFSAKDNRIYNCSLDTANTYDGINVAAGVSNFTITGNEIYNSADYSGLQRFGVVVNAGASDNYMITDNYLRGNQTGGLSDGGTGTHKTVADNLT